jgi:hypothetical protein
MQEASVQELPEVPELKEEQGVLTLEFVGQRFKEWRSRRKYGDRIPLDLWKQAVDLTAQYSISEVSRNLRLSFGDLKNHVSANSTIPIDGIRGMRLKAESPTGFGSDSPTDSEGDFLEVKLGGTNSTVALPHLSMLGRMPDSVRSSCLMELSKSDGSTLKVYSSIGIGEHMERIDINRICEAFLKG